MQASITQASIQSPPKTTSEASSRSDRRARISPLCHMALAIGLSAAFLAPGAALAQGAAPPKSAPASSAAAPSTPPAASAPAAGRPTIKLPQTAPSAPSAGAPAIKLPKVAPASTVALPPVPALGRSTGGAVAKIRLPDEAALRRRLEPKVWAGKASVEEIRYLKAVCSHMGDRACRDQAALMLKAALQRGKKPNAATPKATPPVAPPAPATTTLASAAKPSTLIPPPNDSSSPSGLDEAGWRRMLEPKAAAGTASIEELRFLKAICSHNSDRPCRDHTAALIKKKLDQQASSKPTK
jgi:hypothetical protein